MKLPAWISAAASASSRRPAGLRLRQSEGDLAGRHHAGRSPLAHGRTGLHPLERRRHGDLGICPPAERQHCYMITFGQDHVVAKVEQVLNDANYAKVRVGMSRTTSAACSGAGQKQPFDNLREEIWEWRIEGMPPDGRNLLHGAFRYRQRRGQENLQAVFTVTGERLNKTPQNPWQSGRPGTSVLPRSAATLHFRGQVRERSTALANPDSWSRFAAPFVLRRPRRFFCFAEVIHDPARPHIRTPVPAPATPARPRRRHGHDDPAPRAAGGRLPRRAFADHRTTLRATTTCWCLTRPDIIGGIHREYLEAGADILETCTFNSTAVSQADYNLSEPGYELEFRRRPLARRLCDEFTAANPAKPRFVAGVLGPTSAPRRFRRT